MRSVFGRIFGIPAAAVIILCVGFSMNGKLDPTFATIGTIVTAILVTMFLSWRAAISIVDPVRILLKKVRRFPDDAFPTLRIQAHSEMEELAVTISELLERAKSQFKDLRLEKELLSSLLNGLEEGILCIDRYGLILFQNLSLDPRLVTPDSAGSPFFRSIIHVDLLQFVQTNLFSRNTTVSRTLSGELKINGSLFEMNCTPVVVENEAEMYLLIFRDRTDEKATMRLREEFLQNASHELKTPVTSIRGYAETIRERVSDERLKSFTGAILRNAERMERLIEDMAMISSLESGAFHFAPEEFEVLSFLKDILETAGGMLRARNQQFDIQSASGIRIFADRLLLEHLILNLTANASRYASVGSAIKVRCLKESEKKIVFEVEDDGPGVPDELKEKIFQRFFRVDPNRDRSSGGTGLGLSIVRQITRLHGGEVSVQDAPAGGSIFRVSLPSSLKTI